MKRGFFSRNFKTILMCICIQLQLNLFFLLFFISLFCIPYLFSLDCMEMDFTYPVDHVLRLERHKSKAPVSLCLLIHQHYSFFDLHTKNKPKTYDNNNCNKQYKYQNTTRNESRPKNTQRVEVVLTAMVCQQS